MPTIAELAAELARKKASGALKEVPTQPLQMTAPNLPVMPGGLMPGNNAMDPYSRGPLPSSASTNVDQLRNWESPSVPATRVSPLPALANQQANAAASSGVANQIAPVLDTATQAQSTANTANNTAQAANTTANNALPTPQNLSYTLNSNPLTSIDDGGGNAEIDVAAFTLTVRSKQQTTNVSYNSGTIAGVANSTLYYVYVTDPTLAGGTVSYNAVTTKAASMENSGNIFVGSIVTAASGGSTAIGINNGGVGNQSGSTLVIWPSANSSTYSGSSGAWSNPTFAYDADPTTAATAALNARSLVLSGFASAIPPGAQSVEIVSDYIVAASADFAVTYSTNGGSSFASLFTANNTSRTVQYSPLPSLNVNPGAIQVANVVGVGSCSLYGQYLLFTF
jgi:hypothetical protein